MVEQIRDSNDVRKMLKSFDNNIALDYDNIGYSNLSRYTLTGTLMGMVLDMEVHVN